MKRVPLHTLLVISTLILSCNVLIRANFRHGSRGSAVSESAEDTQDVYVRMNGSRESGLALTSEFFEATVGAFCPDGSSIDGERSASDPTVMVISKVPRKCLVGAMSIRVGPEKDSATTHVPVNELPDWKLGSPVVFKGPDDKETLTVTCTQDTGQALALTGVRRVGLTVSTITDVQYADEVEITFAEADGTFIELISVTENYDGSHTLDLDCPDCDLEQFKAASAYGNESLVPILARAQPLGNFCSKVDDRLRCTFEAPEEGLTLLDNDPVRVFAVVGQSGAVTKVSFSNSGAQASEPTPTATATPVPTETATAGAGPVLPSMTAPPAPPAPPTPGF